MLRLVDAAELSDLTALETMTAELREGTPEQQALAKRFAESIANYYTDSILETLEQQVAPLVVEQQSPEKASVSDETVSQTGATKFCLPQPLYERLVEAAELRKGAPEQQALAKRFAESLANYDTDSILETLEQQVAPLVVEQQSPEKASVSDETVSQTGATDLN